MQQQSGVAPGGDGRVRAAFGDRVSGVNIISDMNGLGGSGGGDIAMATGGKIEQRNGRVWKVPCGGSGCRKAYERRGG